MSSSRFKIARQPDWKAMAKKLGVDPDAATRDQRRDFRLFAALAEMSK